MKPSGGVRDKMRQLSTNQDVPHRTAEIRLHSWCYVDHSGVGFRLAGKAYAFSGSDEEKLAALHHMAGTDHLIGTLGTVPARFTLTSEHGTIPGALPASALSDDQDAFFGSLMDQIERDLRKGIRSVHDNYEQFTVSTPQDPLCATTGVFEQQNGELVARVTANP
jgi:hypothetical protein